LLAPLRARISRVVLGDRVSWLPAGAYVLWYRYHFLPLRLIAPGWIGVPPECVLFCVVREDDAVVYDGMGLVAGELAFRAIIGDAAKADGCAARLRRMLYAEYRIEQRATSLLMHLLDVVGAGKRGATGDSDARREGCRRVAARGVRRPLCWIRTGSRPASRWAAPRARRPRQAWTASAGRRRRRCGLTAMRAMDTLRT